MRTITAFRIFIIVFIASMAATLRGAGFEVRDSVLVIPAGTERIAPRAFADRTDFRRVEFQSPCRLKSIGEYAFLGCTNLEEIILPSPLTSLGEGAFRECGALRSALLPNTLRKLPRYAFAWCGNLSEVTLPSRLADMGSHAFAYCESLGSISLPRTLTHIGSNAFSFCKSLREVTVPASVAELESYAFSECTSLVRATLPANRKLLGELIFSGCRNLREIVEMSAVPPKFDCNSTLFEEGETGMYESCTLRVPASALSLYRRAPSWSRFAHITGE